MHCDLARTYDHNNKRANLDTYIADNAAVAVDTSILTSPEYQLARDHPKNKNKNQ